MAFLAEVLPKDMFIMNTAEVDLCVYVPQSKGVSGKYLFEEWTYALPMKFLMHVQNEKVKTSSLGTDYYETTI